ncbi:mediator of RNA polymerase II transcription subunit 30-like [Babylonia areolata]|uniref:mediator of RNA polymerase II transcription subunit 30-like n=1 Tax=Babylonia areolata TaxID=304850 RepID=UPI003FD57CB6
MAERPTGPHGYSLQSQSSAPSALPSTIQQQPTPPGPQQQQPQPQQVQQQQQQLLSPTKDVNAVNVCRVGQEMVHDIVSKAQEIFQLLSPKSMQLNMNSTQYQEKKTKLDETLTHVSMQFRKLHFIHDKVLEIASQTEEPTLQQLVPEMGMEMEPPVVPNTNAEFYSLVVEQHREIVEQVRMKNQQLKEIIDQLRTIIWEINTMITMRKT